MAAHSGQIIWRQSTLVRTVGFTIPPNHLERGVRFRSRRQMPVLTNLGDSVRDIVGSVRQMRIDRGRLTGQLRWCDDAPAAAVRAKFEAGNLRLNLEIVELSVCVLKRGEEFCGHRGPTTVVCEWQPICARLVASSGGAE